MGASVLAAGALATFALIVVGAVLRTRLRLRGTFWEDLERLAYWACCRRCSCSASRAPTSPGSLWTARWPCWSCPLTVRFNNYIGLTAVTTLFGSHGLALAALAPAGPDRQHHVDPGSCSARPPGRRPSAGAAGSARQPARPRLSASLLLNARPAPAPGRRMAMPGTHLLATSSILLEVLGQAALPVGLLCVGAGLRVPAAWAAVARVLTWSVVLRLVLVPAAKRQVLTGPGS